MALLLLLAQTAGPQQPVAPASIEGVAAKAGTGESLSKVTVTVTLLPSPQSNGQIQAPLSVVIDPATGLTSAIRTANSVASRQSVTTESDGKFRFENLKPGNYQMTASSPGYAPSEYGQRGPNGHGINFTLKAGQKMQNVGLTMTPEGSITGRVVDSNGDPLSRALVQAQKLVYQENGRSLLTVEAIPTDDRGDYRLYWLPPGKYYISATPSDDSSRTMQLGRGGSTPIVLPQAFNQLITIYGGDPRLGLSVPGTVPGVKVTSSTLSNGEVIEEGTVPVYYPSAYDTTKATPVDVRSGEITGGVNITVTTSRVFRIRGTMVDAATGRPLTTATINLVSHNGPLISQAVPVLQTVNTAGFEISGVVPGSYTLYATAGNAGGQLGSGVSLVDVSSTNIDNVIIPVSPPTLISGKVVIEGALPAPAPNAGARLPISIRFEPLNPGIPINNIGIGPDGKLTAVAPLPGDYRVFVTGGSGLVPKSILLDGKDVQTEGIHIGGATSGSMEIVLTSKGGRIEGNVMAERQHVPNATVVLMPTFALRQQSNLYQTVQTNSEGHYSIDNIPPGVYKLFAWDDVPDRAWFDAEFMRDFESQGREITIHESAMETLDVPIIPR
jgi:uncharacterized surface anchored protein